MILRNHASTNSPLGKSQEEMLGIPSRAHSGRAIPKKQRKSITAAEQIGMQRDGHEEFVLSLLASNGGSGASKTGVYVHRRS
jgi:hypothetical protein